jgi:hypothetical protein
MTFGFCHGSYMGVSYMTVLRFPGISIKNGYKPRKEPTKNCSLYQQVNNDRKIVISKSDGGYNKSDCSLIAPKKNNRNANPKSFGNKMKNSITGLFKSKPKQPIQNSNQGIELLGKHSQNAQGEEQEGEKNAPKSSGSKCSIL